MATSLLLVRKRLSWVDLSDLGYRAHTSLLANVLAVVLWKGLGLVVLIVVNAIRIPDWVQVGAEGGLVLEKGAFCVLIDYLELLSGFDFRFMDQISEGRGYRVCRVEFALKTFRFAPFLIKSPYTLGDILLPLSHQVFDIKGLWSVFITLTCRIELLLWRVCGVASQRDGFFLQETCGQCLRVYQTIGKLIFQHLVLHLLENRVLGPLQVLDHNILAFLRCFQTVHQL